MPKVSVIVPVYQAKGYIERCARSLFAQTLDDLEIIFVDDGSPDRSIEIIEEVLGEYPERRAQTHFIRLEHVGVAACRKAGMMAATGDFMIGCDSDDWVDTDMYARMLSFASSGGHDIVICDFVREYNRESSLRRQPVLDDPIAGILTGKLSPSVCNKLVRRTLITDSFIYPEAGMNEDTLISVQVLALAGRIGYMREAPYHYRYHKESQMTANSHDTVIRNWEERCRNARDTIAFLEGAGLADRRAEAIKQYKFSVRNTLAPLLLEGEHYRQWKSTFPEIDRKFLRNSGIPFELKVKYILSTLRVEPVYRRIYKLFKRHK